MGIVMILADSQGYLGVLSHGFPQKMLGSQQKPTDLGAEVDHQMGLTCRAHKLTVCHGKIHHF